MSTRATGSTAQSHRTTLQSLASRKSLACRGHSPSPEVFRAVSSARLLCSQQPSPPEPRAIRSRWSHKARLSPVARRHAAIGPPERPVTRATKTSRNRSFVGRCGLAPPIGLRRGGAGPVGVAVEHHDLCALRDERLHDRPADAAGAAGHQRRAPHQCHARIFTVRPPSTTICWPVT